MASANTNRMSRDDFKKAKELEELRKTGAAPPELDEDGKMINPHIPQYISQAPWYLNQSRPGLKHQRTSHWGGAKQKNVAGMEDWYQRGKKTASDESHEQRKFKPGACTNCGATTHKVKDCVERPRRRGAKLTGSNIAEDEQITQLQFDFDGKRDRWNGYDPAEYKRVIELHEKIESERKKKKLQELDQQMMKKKQRKLEAAAAGEELDSDSDDEDGDDDDARDGGAATKEVELNPALSAARKKARAEARRLRREERQQKKISRKLKLEAAIKDALAANKPAPKDAKAAGMSSDTEQSDSDSDDESDEELRDKGESIQKMDAKSRVTVRNLRIREDTAKYLRNLSAHSAHYDPKTRSMRDNPHPNKSADDVVFAGDNFVRSTGEVRDINALTSFVMNANDRGNDDIHAQALPSQAQMMFEQFKKKKESLKSAQKQEIFDKYGGIDHLKTLPKELLFTQTEQYVEYGEDGKIIKGVERAIPRTKYTEDVLEQNHTMIWGSYWKDGKWGYGCCCQVVRNAFCTGAAGKAAVADISSEMITATKQQAFITAQQSKMDAQKRQAELEARLEAEMKEEEEKQAKIAAAATATTTSKNKRKQKESESSSSSSDSSSDSDGHKKKKKQKKKQKPNKDGDKDDIDMNDPKVIAAIAAQKKKLAEQDGYQGKGGGRYNSMNHIPEPSEAELEEFQRARPSHEDPMANYVDKDID